MADPATPNPALDWRFLYENAACGYLTLNRSLQITRINATAMLWLGHDAASFKLPRPMSQLMSDTDLNGLVDAIDAVTASPASGNYHTPQSFHAQLRRRDSRVFTALFHLNIDDREPDSIHLAAFHLHQYERLVEALATTNIELKDAQQQSQWRIRRLSAIAQATPDAILSIDKDQKVTFANPAAWKMFRTTMDEMIGAGLDRFIPQRFREAHRHHIEMFGRSGVTTRQMAGALTVMGLRADGSEFPVEASISQVTIDNEPTFTVILRDVTERVSADQRLERTRQSLAQLTARLRSVREEEQRHVARELHDDVGQQLSALRMDVAALRDALPADQPKLFDMLENMDELVSSTVVAVRRLASGLRPKILDELGLVPALEAFAKDIESRSGLQCKLVADEQLSVASDRAITLFRIAQEAVHNTIKHAHAKRISIRVSEQDDFIRLTIRDDGRGMRRDDEHKPNSLGLIGMRERATSLGGQMHIHSAPNQGTMIECVVPLSGPDGNDIPLGPIGQTN